MSKTTKSILAGAISTALMTMFMISTQLLGMPKMSPPDMLAGMMGIPVVVGWLMHFMIGMTFAAGYAYVFDPRVKINNLYLKGVVFGLAAFVFAQIGLGIMGAIFPMPPVQGSMALVMIGSVLSHVVFGIAVAQIAGKSVANHSQQTLINR